MDIDFSKKYSCGEYLMLNLDLRTELIDGFIKLLPSPTFLHQDIVADVTAIFRMFVRRRKGKCKVITSPIDVKLSETIVVQPDICVVCDLSKVQNGIIAGAPDMIIEVISPSSIEEDRKEKFIWYERYGVNEYWIVYPNEQIIVVYLLRDGKYADGIVYHRNENNKIMVHTIPELEFSVTDLFDNVSE